MLYCVVSNSVYCDISNEGKVGRSSTYEQFKMKALCSLEMSGYVKLHITQFSIPEGNIFCGKIFTAVTHLQWSQVPLMTHKASLLLLTVVFPSNHVWPLLWPKAILTNEIMWLALTSVWKELLDGWTEIHECTVERGGM